MLTATAIRSTARIRSCSSNKFLIRRYQILQPESVFAFLHGSMLSALIYRAKSASVTPMASIVARAFHRSLPLYRNANASTSPVRADT